MREVDYILEIAGFNEIRISLDDISSYNGRLLTVKDMTIKGLKFSNELMYAKWVYLYQLYIGRDEQLLQSHIKYLQDYNCY